MNINTNKKYVFIMNSTKPSKQEYEALTDISINNFSRPCLEAAHELGYEVILGVNRKYPEKLKCKELPYLKFYNSNSYRNIFSIRDNFQAYKNLNNVLKEGNVKVIHCNTPIGGFVGRICGHKYKIDKIIYTAHGFHFFKNAPLFNNTILKWIEFFLARWTDIIITINEEDYKAAKRMKLKKEGKIYKINGVGINLEDYQNINVDYKAKRKELGIKNGDFVCIAMGDLVKRKNFGTGIKAIKECNNSRVHYLICGDGPEKRNLKKLAHKLNIDRQIHFLGYRSDIKELLKISNCFLFTSLQEGLPRSTMEAMASGLPCIVSNIRGNVDLIDQNGGYLINELDYIKYAQILNYLANDETLCKGMAKYNINKMAEYDSHNIYKNIKDIYISELLDKKIERRM